MVADLLPDPAGPAAAAYPNTLPAAAALFGTAEAVRYGHFLEQLQVCVRACVSCRAQQTTERSTASPAACCRRVSLTRATAYPTVQAAAWQEDESAGAAAGAAADELEGAGGAGAPPGGLPSLLQLSGILAGASAEGAAPAGTEVTGPSAPLALALSHSVDGAARAITLRCAVHNRTLEGIKGVEVGCSAAVVGYAVATSAGPGICATPP